MCGLAVPLNTDYGRFQTHVQRVSKEAKCSSSDNTAMCVLVQISQKLQPRSSLQSLIQGLKLSLLACK